MSDHIENGQKLTPGQSLVSNSGKFHLYMSSRGHVTLYRFEAGRDPVNMWRFYCYHQRVYGEPHIAIVGGFLKGGDHRYNNQPTYWWARPRNGFGNPVPNPILYMQDDGNLVLYSRDNANNRGGAAWSTGTNGNYNAAINPDFDNALVATGTLSVNANTIIENTLSDPINVSDGRTAIVLNPGQTAGAHAPSGPGSLAIDFESTSYNLDDGSLDAVPAPNHTTSTAGNVVRLAPGNHERFNWHEEIDHNFSHLQLTWESEDTKNREYRDQKDA